MNNSEITEEFLSESIWVAVQVKKEEAAFFYATLEACEGLAHYTTRKGNPHDLFRIIDLNVPVSCWPDMEDVLSQLGEVVSVLESDKESESWHTELALD